MNKKVRKSLLHLLSCWQPWEKTRIHFTALSATDHQTTKTEVTASTCVYSAALSVQSALQSKLSLCLPHLSCDVSLEWHPHPVQFAVCVLPPTCRIDQQTCWFGIHHRKSNMLCKRVLKPTEPFNSGQEFTVSNDANHVKLKYRKVSNIVFCSLSGFQIVFSNLNATQGSRWKESQSQKNAKYGWAI